MNLSFVLFLKLATIDSSKITRFRELEFPKNVLFFFNVMHFLYFPTIEFIHYFSHYFLRINITRYPVDLYLLSF